MAASVRRGHHLCRQHLDEAVPIPRGRAEAAHAVALAVEWLRVGARRLGPGGDHIDRGDALLERRALRGREEGHGVVEDPGVGNAPGTARIEAPVARCRPAVDPRIVAGQPSIDFLSLQTNSKTNGASPMRQRTTPAIIPTLRRGPMIRGCLIELVATSLLVATPGWRVQAGTTCDDR